MASTINATTSGVVTTGDSVATLSLQTGGTTAVAIDSAQIVSLSKSLALLGSTSGSVSIAAPATAGTQSYTLPTAVPAVNGYALTATTGGVMSWAAASATPGGSTTQVQYNNSGSFAGSSNMTFDGTTLTAAGFSGPLNGTVGATTANTGSFTTLAASSTVSGTGFSTYLASPPAIGGTAPAAGTFTTAKAIAASTQDAVQLQGRAGGTSSYVATITPTTLTASRTFTLPDAAGTLLLSGGDLGTPSAGVVTNLTGTASININGTVGATTANAGTFSSTVHKGATSGTITLTAPAVAGTQSYTLPTAVPAVSGYALTSTTAGVMSWAASGSGSPGGSTTQVQYNNGGAFGGISGFTTDGTRVTASTTIGVGGATPATTGSGITFPSTPSNSSNVNTLDDYERGTWTPTVGGTATYTIQKGYYVKIGRLVYVTCVMEVSLIGTGSTTTISGMPFTTFSSTDISYPLGIRTWASLATSVLYIVPTAVNGQQTIQFNNTSTAGTSNGANTVAIFGNSARVDIAGCFYTND